MATTSISTDDEILKRLKAQAELNGQSLSKYLTFNLKKIADGIGNVNKVNTIDKNDEDKVDTDKNVEDLPRATSEADIDIDIKPKKEKANNQRKTESEAANAAVNDYFRQKELNDNFEETNKNYKELNKKYDEMCNGNECLEASIKEIKDKIDKIDELKDKLNQFEDGIDKKIVEIIYNRKDEIKNGLGLRSDLIKNNNDFFKELQKKGYF